ncbi:MAG: TetR/AcrR family transcriptional regulator [Clostridium sp.]|nr:TetR/AcrR family transcriptional regulator [Clostridium sp.]MCM1397914.1 TetR/AcrR family transcriptional regulator [Clostridium sp.]MCM1459152.1 TetR/AcrR family transcriptional regulator [Bacteroides sp.]
MGSKGVKTKEKILQEAYLLFAEKGFKAVTMTDICEKTGLSRGGLYRYYSGTEQIFSEIISKEYVISDRIERQESAISILEDMLHAIRCEIMDKELSLSLAIYEYANLGNGDFFTTINDKAKKRWISLLEYGMETKEFQLVDVDQVSDLILYYYQGLRMWSRVISFDEQVAENYVRTVKQLLLREPLMG